MMYTLSVETRLITQGLVALDLTSAREQDVSFNSFNFIKKSVHETNMG